MTRTISAVGQPATTHASSLLYPDRRGRLLASSVLTRGALRCVAAAAGMMTVLGVSPAFAQCFSGTTGNLLTIACQAIVPGGTSTTAVGSNANAFGQAATAYGNSSTANGIVATATGAGSTANGDLPTATGTNSLANG